MSSHYKGSYVPKVGINGFGRIGRILVRAAFDKPGYVNIACINNATTDLSQMVYGLMYDTSHAKWDKDVSIDESTNELIINKTHRIKVIADRDPAKLYWNDYDIDWVIDATGAFSTVDKAKLHQHERGCKNVLISQPSPDAPTYVMGVNNYTYDPKHTVISNASCTTNCVSPIAKVINDNFEITEGFVSTIHAMTATQKVVDCPAKGKQGKKELWRKARCGVANIIPTTTGAAKAVGKVIPELTGKFTGIAFRVPTFNVSLVDFTVRTKKATSLEEINALMEKCSTSPEWEGVLGFTAEPLVSADFMGDHHATNYDAGASIELNPNFFKLISWYDNEYGYSVMCLNMVHYCANRQQGTL